MRALMSTATVRVMTPEELAAGAVGGVAGARRARRAAIQSGACGSCGHDLKIQQRHGHKLMRLFGAPEPPPPPPGAS